MQPLVQQHCRNITQPVALNAADIKQQLVALELWHFDEQNSRLCCHLKFTDFHQVTSFSQALFWLIEQQDHHPDLHLSYNTCSIKYSTHSVQGISIKDLICAAKINALLQEIWQKDA